MLPKILYNERMVLLIAFFLFAKRSLELVVTRRGGNNANTKLRFSPDGHWPSMKRP